MVIEWWAEDTEEALKAAYLGARDRWVRMRLQALWLLRCGWRMDTVAEAVGTEYRSVQRWVAWYRHGGLAEVQAHRMGGVGQPAWLTAEQQEAVAAEVATGRFRTALPHRGGDPGLDRHRVRGGLHHRRRLRAVRPVALRAQSPPPGACQGRPRAADGLEKGGFRAALSAAGLTAATALGFADELRVGLRGMVRRVWGRRGVKVQQRLQLSYKWRYLFLVVDGQGGRLHWCWLDSMAGEELLAAVGGLQQETDIGALVWDGAPSHRDQNVSALGLPLIGLPPYSPELNPAERVFEEIRRWVEGTVYPTLADKVAAVEAFLAELDAEPARIRSLAGWDWITAALPQPSLDFTA